MNLKSYLNVWSFLVILTVFLVSVALTILPHSEKFNRKLLGTRFSPLKKDTYLAADCMIFDIFGRTIRHLPFTRCIFFEDGSLISSDLSPGRKNLLSMSNAHGKLIWGLPVSADHTMSLCRENKAIVVTTSKDQWFKGQLTRGDRIAVVDLAGNILYTWDLLDHYEELKPFVRFIRGGSPILLPEHFETLRSKALSEVTHVNSAYEIPDNENSKNMSAFQKGNFIVNPLGEHLIILSADLKQILWISKKEYNAHDVQVLENGNLLLFRNQLERRIGERPFILEINPLDESIVWSYEGSPKLSATLFGSVSYKNGLFVLTGNPDIKYITVINRRGQVLTNFTPDIQPFPSSSGFFHVQFLNHNGFMKNDM